MEFAPLAFTSPCNLPNPEAAPGSSAHNRFYCYGVIGRLALLAASIELERTASLTPTRLAEADGLMSVLAREAGQESGMNVEARS
jgi:hypothetical protein